jgi:hypothetical protein
MISPKSVKILKFVLQPPILVAKGKMRRRADVSFPVVRISRLAINTLGVRIIS